MGAEEFIVVSKGKTAKEAFDNAVKKAQYDHGHAGYSGTIAEKSEFTVIPCPEGRKPSDYAEELLEKEDPRVNGKWGPAGCIKIADGRWLFFGWASS